MYENYNKFDNFHNLASQISPWVCHYVLNEHYSEHFTDFLLIRKSILEKNGALNKCVKLREKTHNVQNNCQCSDLRSALTCDINTVSNECTLFLCYFFSCFQINFKCLHVFS